MRFSIAKIKRTYTLLGYPRNVHLKIRKFQSFQKLRSMRDLICDNTDLVNVQRNPFQASNAESGNDKSDNKSDNDFM